MSNYTRTVWNLILIAGGKQYHCVSYSSTFALNRIPVASCTLASGRDVRTLKRALIHETADEFRHMMPVAVILRPRGHWATREGLDGDKLFQRGLWSEAGEQVIFRGYLTGFGFNKSRGKLQVAAQLIHWLADLSFSSIFSNQSHPQSPGQFTRRAANAVSGGTANSRSFVSSTNFSQFFTPSRIQKDLWGECLANVFCKMSEEDLIQLGSPESCGGQHAPNDQALAALARFEGAHECDETENKWHVPLSMEDLGTQGGSIADGMRSYTGRQAAEGWWADTIWNKLVGDLAPSFLFHIVPRTETALATPYTPGLREPFDKELHAADFETCSLSGLIPRPIRGVGIRAETETMTSGASTDLHNLMGVGGCFMPDPDAKGMILIKNAPPWLAHAVLTRPPRRRMSGATTPGADDTQETSVTDITLASRNFYDQYAHYLYVQEVLRGRQGMVAGKFRLDIAPGSTVRLIDFGGLYLGDDRLSGTAYASVLRVDCHLDAEQSAAGTTFQLAHIRTDKENEDDRFSVEKHPFYDKPYHGCPLVDAYHFPASESEPDDEAGDDADRQAGA